MDKPKKRGPGAKRGPKPKIANRYGRPTKIYGDDIDLNASNIEFNKKIRNASFLDARAQILSKKLNPIDMLYDVYKRAIEAFEQRQVTNKGGDPGPSYLAVAAQSAGQLAKYVYPTLAAVKVDVNNHNMPKKIDIKEAIKIITSDPFTRSAVDQMNFTQAIDEKIDKDIMPILPLPKQGDDEERSKLTTEEMVLAVIPDEMKPKE
jgi:hypothetical protein